MLSLLPEAPHLICLSEHHLKQEEIDNTHIPLYKLGANYCRTSLKCGGVCIFLHENIIFSNINLIKHNKEQDLEITAVKLKLIKKNIIVACVYRAPTGNMDYFLQRIEIILNSLQNAKTEIILCGDLNINFKENNNNKIRLEQLLNSFNLKGTVHFPTRTTNTSSTIIDNIFIDVRNNYIIKPHINGLSDHDAQIIKIDNYSLTIKNKVPNYTRNINEQTIVEFQNLLSWELWEDVFNTNDTNTMFNNFLNTYLRCYNASFATKKVFNKNRFPNGWITKGIKVSCKRKSELFVLARSSSDYDLKLYYKKYCAILTKVIRKAKKLYYDNLILSAKNKMKTTWQIINKETGTNQHKGSISSLTMNDTVVSQRRWWVGIVESGNVG